MRRHYDEIAGVRFGEPDDGLCRKLGNLMQRIDGDAVLCRFLLDGRISLLHARVDLLVISNDRIFRPAENRGLDCLRHQWFTEYGLSQHVSKAPASGISK
jgi:hypothetical protein